RTVRCGSSWQTLRLSRFPFICFTPDVAHSPRRCVSSWILRRAARGGGWVSSFCSAFPSVRGLLCLGGVPEGAIFGLPALCKSLLWPARGGGRRAVLRL